MSTPSNPSRFKADVAQEIKKGVELALSHGPLYRGKGMVSGLIALALANFSGVLRGQAQAAGDL